MSILLNNNKNIDDETEINNIHKKAINIRDCNFNTITNLSNIIFVTDPISHIFCDENSMIYVPVNFLQRSSFQFYLFMNKFEEPTKFDNTYFKDYYIMSFQGSNTCYVNTYESLWNLCWQFDLVENFMHTMKVTESAIVPSNKITQNYFKYPIPVTRKYKFYFKIGYKNKSQPLILVKYIDIFDETIFINYPIDFYNIYDIDIFFQ